MTTTLDQLPTTRATGATSASCGHTASCPRERRRRTAPHDRGSVGVRWHSRARLADEASSTMRVGLGDLVTGGVARLGGTSRGRTLASRVVLGAFATIAVVCIAAGAVRLGFLPDTSTTSVALATLVIAACGVVAFVACRAELDAKPWSPEGVDKMIDGADADLDADLGADLDADLDADFDARCSDGPDAAHASELARSWRARAARTCDDACHCSI